MSNLHEIRGRNLRGKQGKSCSLQRGILVLGNAPGITGIRAHVRWS